MNKYCDKIGMPAPRVEDFAAKKNVKLFHLVIIALLERGGPMTLDEIADRLEDADVFPPSGDWETSIVKGWKGREFLYRDPDGRFCLNVDSDELDLLLFGIGARKPRHEPEPELRLPGPDVPLTQREVEAAVRGGCRQLTPLRQAAAVLDAFNRVMTAAEIETYLSSLNSYRWRISAETPRFWRSPMIVVKGDGRLELNRNDPDVFGMRQAVRDLARRGLKQQQDKERMERIAAKNREREESETVKAAALRRAIVHSAEPGVVGILNADGGPIRVVRGTDISNALEDFDVLAGLNIRDLLYSLKLDVERWRLADLKAPRKSVHLGTKVVKVTAEMFIRSSLGIRKPLIGRREEDLRTLQTYYRYGVLHRQVRLKWRHYDELYPVEWAVPGDPTMSDLLGWAKQHGQKLDVVLAPFSGLKDPLRLTGVEVDWIDGWNVSLRQDRYFYELSQEGIVSVKLHEAGRN